MAKMYGVGEIKVTSGNQMVPQEVKMTSMPTANATPPKPKGGVYDQLMETLYKDNAAFKRKARILKY